MQIFLIKNLLKKVYKNLTDYNKNFSFSLSIGIQIIKSDTFDIENAIEEAHIANRKLKTVRGISFRFYNDKEDKLIFTNQSIIPFIRSGLKNKEFTVYYQPIINSKTNEEVFTEALVRWNSKTLGFIKPNDFIPVLEKNGFITELDFYVREEVLRFLRAQIDKNDIVFPISVNISRLELENTEFPSLLQKQLEKYKIPTYLLRLEVTESIVMENPDIAKNTINTLKSYGFFLEMDDFGSAYSSLAVLREFPFDLIKLDMKFFKENTHNIMASAIIEAISSLASKTNLEVIAEGVENEAIIKYLKKIDIHYIQGFFYSKPIPELDFLRFINATNKINLN